MKVIHTTTRLADLLHGLSIHHTGLAQELTLTCSPTDDNGTSYFPDVPIDDDILTNSIRGSQYLSQLRTYVYQFQPATNDGCTITEIEFCYEDTGDYSNLEMAFILLRGNDIGSPTATTITVTLLETVTINTTVMCNGSSDVCCDSPNIDVSLLAQADAFAIRFPDQLLLEYNESQSQVQTFVVEGFELRGAGDGGPIFEARGYFTRLNLRLLRFKTTSTNISVDIITESNVIPIAVGSVVGAIVAMAVLIATVVLVVVFIVKCQHKKWSVSVNLSTKPPFSNAVYDGKTC